MSILTTTNSNQPDLLAPRTNTPDLRTPSAADAPGFAQVLQVFDREESSALAESSSQDDLSTSGDDEASSASTSSSSDNTTSGEQSEQDVAAGGEDSSEQADQPSGQDQAAQSSDATAGTDEHGSNQSSNDQDQSNVHANQASGDGAAGASENTQSQAARQEVTGLDLLSNKSDQAKLSIRGLVRAIRADSSQDSTAIAVQTQLGQTPAKSTDQTQPIQPLSADEKAPKPVQADQPTRTGVVDPRDALSDTPPTSDRPGSESKRTPSVPGAHLTPARDVPAEQARTESGQVQSTRAEAAVQASTSRAPEPMRADALHSAGRSETISRVEGALTARAVGGVDAGQTRVGTEAQARMDQSLKATPSDQQALQSKLMAQVQRGLAQLMRSASGEMTLRLTPERLGEVKIEIKRSGEQLAVRLTTQNAEARELLSSGTDELTQLLRAKGVDVERVHIDQQGADAPGQDERDLAERGSDDGSDANDGSHRDQGASSESESSLAGDDADQNDGIWTELGLDAIA